MTLSEINQLDHQGFVAALGSLFEGPPWIVEAAWVRRPFASEQALHAALCEVMYAAPHDAQLALLRTHPDLAGKLALAGELSADSAREQATAGLSSLTPTELEEFTRLNSEYRARFGFPFVICARLSTKDSIRAAFAQRLTHAYDEELQTALGEVAKICALRLHDLLARDDTA